MHYVKLVLLIAFKKVKIFIQVIGLYKRDDDRTASKMVNEKVCVALEKI